MTTLSGVPSGLAIAIVAVAAVLAQDGIRKERIGFAAGATSGTVKRAIKGDQIVD